MTSERLIHFNRLMTHDEVVDALDKMGLQSLYSHELQSFLDKYPAAKRRKYPIVAAYTYRGIRHLCKDWETPEGERRVIHMVGERYPEYCRFIAKRKRPANVAQKGE